MIALFDMDGTLFDFEGQMRKDLKVLASPEENFDWDNICLWDLEEEHAHIKARMDLIKNRPGWWRDLPKFNIGWEILRIVHAYPLEVHILTKGPSSRPHAWTEKVECINKHFGPDGIDRMPQIHITENKGVHYGRILVDDFPGYIEAWLLHRPRGLVLMPASGTNADFTHPNVIRIDDNFDDYTIAAKAIKAATKREDGQHWKELFEEPVSS
jgi:5'-nucleotidase